MLSWLFGKSLQNYLEATKTVRIKGFKFTIRKLGALNYIDGTKTIRQTYDTYKTKSQEPTIYNDEKTYKHIKEVICGCTVHPRIVHKSEEEGIFIDKLTMDMDIFLGLYNEIIFYTYGKKKILKLASQGKKLSK